jgi:hydrogenase maturation protein HypF
MQPSTEPSAHTGRRVRVRGVVQGVGFRPWVVRTARALGLAGSVRNDGAGVVIEAFGARAGLEDLLARLAAPEPPAARVESIEHEPLPGPAPCGFRIEPSETDTGAHRLPVAPDLATCEDCLAEAADPASRRFADPFVSCARCGPRFSVLRALPFDRARTTLAAFPRCAACAADYDEPEDRRFHAETSTCPACGPRLALLDANGAARARGAEAIAAAARVLRAGGVVAVLGLGGFHLACDATSDAAVASLRLRKRRARKPLAVMVRDLAAASRLARLGDGERALLASPERPIVLVARRSDAPLSGAVAPGSPRLGLLLPYTALHHQLLAAAGVPLVMTSGNRAGDPLAHEVSEALVRLGKIADAFLAHDRAIAEPCDDSVALEIAGAPTWIRRARGLVPRALRLARPVPRPVLAVGGHLHNTVCLAAGDQAVLSRHHGDLESPEACDAFGASIASLVSLLGVEPGLVAHDLHPRYRPTLWAQRRDGVRKMGVQHHHAHVASVLAEHGVDEPVLGLAWDGTGYGADGTSWGGELLLADASRFRRVSTLRAIPLAGGERALREVWRLALAVLDDAFDGDPPWKRLPLSAHVTPERVGAVRRLLRAPALAPRAHGAGRWFDAVGALVLGLPEADFQGEVALAWNHAAAETPAAPYPVSLDRSRDPFELDLRPAVRGVVADVLGERSASEIAARFHATLAAAAAAQIEAAAREHGARPVALAGGCFQNALLVERILDTLGASATVLRAREVPPGDGGLALGQVAVAAARLRDEGAATCA